MVLSKMLGILGLLFLQELVPVSQRNDLAMHGDGNSLSSQ